MLPVFFNWVRSAERNGSVSGIRLFCQIKSTNRNYMTFVSTGRIFCVQNVFVVLQELTALPGSRSWWGGGSLPLPITPSPLSAFGLEFQPFVQRFTMQSDT